MKRMCLFWGAVVVLLTNGLALYQVAGNRSGTPLRTITLSERELPRRIDGADNSSVSLRLVWRQSPSEVPGRPSFRRQIFDEAKLRELGFACPPPDSTGKARKPLSAAVYVAFELQQGTADAASRLIYKDASRSLYPLLRDYPDQERYLIVPALVDAVLEGEEGPKTEAKTAPRWVGFISSNIPPEIYVPPPHSRIFSRISQKPGSEAHYRVTLQYGRNMEPWVSAMELEAPQP